MEKRYDVYGRRRHYGHEEALSLFVPIRDKIFPFESDGLPGDHRRTFRDDSWERVIIQGALQESERTELPPLGSDPERDILDWLEDDPRDELQPLFDILLEDGVDEIIQMSLATDGPFDAVGALPHRDSVRVTVVDYEACQLLDRLMFDRTGRWGFYGSSEAFGLLGGEPAFMERYIARAGGMDFIRRKADEYWQAEVELGIRD